MFVERVRERPKQVESDRILDRSPCCCWLLSFCCRDVWCLYILLHIKFDYSNKCNYMYVHFDTQMTLHVFQQCPWLSCDIRQKTFLPKWLVDASRIYQHLFLQWPWILLLPPLLSVTRLARRISRPFLWFHFIASLIRLRLLGLSGEINERQQETRQLWERKDRSSEGSSLYES